MPCRKPRPFPKIADEWARQHEPEITEATRRAYTASLNRLKTAFPQPAAAIRPLDVKRYFYAFEREGRAAGTVQTELAVCKMIFSHAVMAGDIDLSPAAGVRKSRKLPRQKRQALTEEQEAAVKSAGERRSGCWWLFGYLLLYTGLRRGEALALTYGDIDRKRGVIHVTKKLSYVDAQHPRLEDRLKSENGRREVPLLPPLADALPHDRAGLIFPGKNGGFMKASELRSSWQAYCRDIGLEGVTPHCFRHSFATICYEAGLDPRQTAQILGNTPDVLERTYTHLRKAHRQGAADILTAHLAAK